MDSSSAFSTDNATNIRTSSGVAPLFNQMSGNYRSTVIRLVGGSSLETHILKPFKLSALSIFARKAVFSGSITFIAMDEL